MVVLPDLEVAAVLLDYDARATPPEPQPEPPAGTRVPKRERSRLLAPPG